MAEYCTDLSTCRGTVSRLAAMWRVACSSSTPWRRDAPYARASLDLGRAIGLDAPMQDATTDEHTRAPRALTDRHCWTKSSE